MYSQIIQVIGTCLYTHGGVPAIPEVDAAVCSSLLLVDPRSTTHPKLATPPLQLRPLAPLGIALLVASGEMIKGDTTKIPVVWGQQLDISKVGQSLK